MIVLSLSFGMCHCRWVICRLRDPIFLIHHRFSLCNNSIPTCYKAHYGLEKYHYLEEITPPDADRYWLRVLAPPFTYGAKHVILFQLAVIPLTMCRLTIVHASGTFLKRLIPFNHILKSHIAIGYGIVVLVRCYTMGLIKLCTSMRHVLTFQQFYTARQS